MTEDNDRKEQYLKRQKRLTIFFLIILFSRLLKPHFKFNLYFQRQRRKCIFS